MGTPCFYHNGPLYPGFGMPKDIEIVAIIKEGVGEKGRKMKRKSTIIRGRYGRGKVVLCGPHPEQTEGLEEFTWKLIEHAFPE